VNQEYVQFAGPLLAIAGAAFQWVRQYNGVPERYTYVYALALAIGVYALCFDYTAHVAVQAAIINALLWLSGSVATVLGGTFTASSAAKAGLAAVPMTNSK
jgi:hypothetical protein